MNHRVVLRCREYVPLTATLFVCLDGPRPKALRSLADSEKQRLRRIQSDCYDARRAAWAVVGAQTGASRPELIALRLETFIQIPLSTSDATLLAELLDIGANDVDAKDDITIVSGMRGSADFRSLRDRLRQLGQ